MSRYSYGRFPPYVRVADRKKKALKMAEKLKKKGQILEPISIEGRTIAKTFWGKAWCDNLESYRDDDNRLPRGRTYVRNGSVIDFKIAKGEITAMVSGSSVYKVKIVMTEVVKSRWQKIVKACSGKIDSLIELLQGTFSKAVMEVITDPKTGLFPNLKEIKFSCSCPDWADMCKHVAAVLYAVGARLDHCPEELFTLRHACHLELMTKASKSSLTKKAANLNNDDIFAESDLSSLFGIELGEATPEKKKSTPKKKKIISTAVLDKPKAKVVKKVVKKTVKKQSAVNVESKKILPKKTAAVKKKK